MWLRVIGVLKNNQKTQVVLMTFKTNFELEMHDEKQVGVVSQNFIYTLSVPTLPKIDVNIFIKIFLWLFYEERRKLLEANDLLHITNVTAFRVS